jgi:hypothetical protein
MRGDYRAKIAGKTEVEVTENLYVPVESPAAAFVCLYKGKAKDAPLHALGVQVIQGDKVIAAIEPQHFMRLKNRHVNEHLVKILSVLKERFGITEFERQVIRLEPEECPIPNCPLPPKTSFNWS